VVEDLDRPLGEGLLDGAHPTEFIGRVGK
jgi:hypothetical protein